MSLVISAQFLMDSTSYYSTDAAQFVTVGSLYSKEAHCGVRIKGWSNTWLFLPKETFHSKPSSSRVICGGALYCALHPISGYNNVCSYRMSPFSVTEWAHACCGQRFDRGPGKDRVLPGMVLSLFTCWARSRDGELCPFQVRHCMGGWKDCFARWNSGN